MKQLYGFTKQLKGCCNVTDGKVSSRERLLIQNYKEQKRSEWHTLGQCPMSITVQIWTVLCTILYCKSYLVQRFLYDRLFVVENVMVVCKSVV